MKPILVGESNPYGSAPEYALYPYPENSAGGRLCRAIMGLEPHDYIRRFDRRNLCPEKWSSRVARQAAGEIIMDADTGGSGRTVVLLGSKVASAFAFEFKPYFVVDRVILPHLSCVKFVILPHPSGLSRLWNEPGAYARARDLLRHVEVL